MQQYDEFSGSLQLRDDDNKHIRKHFVKILTDNRNGKKNSDTLYFNCLGCSSHTYYLYNSMENYVKKCQLSN